MTVKFKPLEWNPYRAETPFGYYDINDQRSVPEGELKGRLPFLLSGSRLDYSRHATLEDARAAAQADYETRIMAALTNTSGNDEAPDGMPERIWLFQPYRELSTDLCGPSDIWYGEKDLADHDIQDGIKHEYVYARQQSAAVRDEAFPCPCTMIEQDEDCIIGYPSMVCGICNGTGNASQEQVAALAVEMIKVASDLGEPEDPFAAWESVSLIQSHNEQLRKEAAIAWEVCASIHREYAKKKDPFFTTRQQDFVNAAEKARSPFTSTQTPAERFAKWLEDGPKLAKAVGCYVGIKVSQAIHSTQGGNSK